MLTDTARNTVATTRAEFQRLHENIGSTRSAITDNQEAQFHQFALRVRTLVEFSLQSAAFRQRQRYTQISDLYQTAREPALALTSHPHVAAGGSSHPLDAERTSDDSNDAQDTSDAVLQLHTANNTFPLRCPESCCCRCHRMPSFRLVPRWLALWIGDIHLPRTLLSSLCSFLTPCTDSTCVRTQEDLTTIKFFLPSWFAEVDATIRFNAFPVHFTIQTPRVVQSLDYLNGVTVDDVKRLLSNREMTLLDVEPDGGTILHVRTCIIMVCLLLLNLLSW